MIEKFSPVKFRPPPPPPNIVNRKIAPKVIVFRKISYWKITPRKIGPQQMSHKRLPGGALSSGRLSWDDRTLRACCFFQIRLENLPAVSKNLKYLKETVHTTFFKLLLQP